MTMLERIAEITCSIELGGIIYGTTKWCSAHEKSPIDGEKYYIRGLGKAENILDIMADLNNLPEKAMNAAIEAHDKHEDFTITGDEEDETISCSCTQWTDSGYKAVDRWQYHHVSSIIESYIKETKE